MKRLRKFKAIDKEALRRKMESRKETLLRKQRRGFKYV